MYDVEKRISLTIKRLKNYLQNVNVTNLYMVSPPIKVYGTIEHIAISLNLILRFIILTQKNTFLTILRN